MQNEFVIQMHSGYGPVHYDLMLQKDDVLATWQLACRPSGTVGESMAAKQLDDHRAEYLSYEGPVSGERGRVEIVDRGTYELISEDNTHWVIRFCGRHISGTYELTHTGPGDNWHLARTGE